MFCQSQAYPIENKPEKARFSTLLFPKKTKVFTKSQIFKNWLQTSQIGNHATQELRMRIKCARQISIFVMYRSPANLVFVFPC